jgi:hypothetical protein
LEDEDADIWGVGRDSSIPHSRRLFLLLPRRSRHGKGMRNALLLELCGLGTLELVISKQNYIQQERHGYLGET